MTKRRRVLVAGGGVAGLEATAALHELAAGLVEVELIAHEPRYWYRAAAVAEPFGVGRVRSFDLADLAHEAGARFTHGELVGVDAGAHVAYTETGTIEYDALLLACGAVPHAVIPGAITFRGPADTGLIADLLRELDAGTVTRVAVAIPLGAHWSLPAYELALMIAGYVDAAGLPDVEISVVTPEDSPLLLFGTAARDAVETMLAERGIMLCAGACATEVVRGELHLTPAATIPVDRVVALPRLYGPRIDGLAQTRAGFVAVDSHGRVAGLTDVFAAGDLTNFPVKQGGLAAQQADAAAEAIAAWAGAAITPRPFRPVLRGLLLTGAAARYLRRDVSHGDHGAVSIDPLWWPPAKVVGHHLTPLLIRVGDARDADEPRDDAVEIDVPIDVEDVTRVDRELSHLADGDDDQEPTAADLMTTAFVVAAPEDTLGEVAEQLAAHDTGSVLVMSYGRLTGILTSRDLLRAIAGRVHSSEARVREWMTTEPIVVSPETPVSTALQLMNEHGVHRLPVVEREHTIGVIGLRQAARAVATLRPARVGLGF